MNYIVYFAYGGIDFQHEILYSLISYYKFHEIDENKLIIYTDNVAFYKNKLPKSVLYFELEEQTISSWKGKNNFVHRTKIKLLQEITSNFNGNFLYLDSDTYFTKNTSQLFSEINNNMVYFDRCEGKLIDNTGGIARKMRTFLNQENLFSIASCSNEIKIDSDFIVWNAGVIGFNSSHSNKLFLVEELTDVLYSKCKLFIMEQVAFNYFFQIDSKPQVTENFIHHYWYFKEFRTVLKDFFNHNKLKKIEELVVEIDKINPEYLSKEKRNYKKMSFWQKQYHKITKGRKWKIMEYKL